MTQEESALKRDVGPWCDECWCIAGHEVDCPYAGPVRVRDAMVSAFLLRTGARGTPMALKAAQGEV